MCFSAMVEADVRKLARRFGAKIDVEAFADLYEARLETKSIKIPRALDASLVETKAAAALRLRAAIETYRRRRASALEQEIKEQSERMVRAMAALQQKETKKAQEDLRIATKMVKKAELDLEDLRRTDPKARDSRIFPGGYAPVVIAEKDGLVIRPMRYLLRRSGKPASDDRRYSGCYNARRDTIRDSTFWKGQFGITHGVMVISSFFENVAVHDFERRPLAEGESSKNMVLHFNPRPAVEMVVACLWSHWEAPGERALDSIAAITDEPPPEVAETGHDRCVVVLREQNVDAWLHPAGQSSEQLHQLLTDREPLYYEHKLAA